MHSQYCCRRVNRNPPRHGLHQTPKAWLTAQRQAMALLRDGSSIKETAACLGYNQQTNFTRKFKEHWGICPTATISAHSIRGNVAK